MAATKVKLDSPQLYLNRELSQLRFIDRVLRQSQDERVPLLERFRFLCISCTIMDEFFEVRVAGLRQQRAYGLGRTGPDGLSPRECLDRIGQRAHRLVARQYKILNDELLPALTEAGIDVLKRKSWRARHKRWARRYFNEQVLPVLSPIALDSAHPFPRIHNKALTFAVELEGEDAFKRDSGVAVVRVPRSLPRMIAVPTDIAEASDTYVLLSSVVHANIDALFPGMRVRGCFQFRVTRNSDLWVDEEEVDDLLRALRAELANRHYGDAVRLEVADNCPEKLAKQLLSHFELDDEDLYRVDGPVNLNRFATLYDNVDHAELKYEPFVPAIPPALVAAPDVFELVRRKSVLLHHPFESFTPVMELVRSAAADPSVLAIRQTLYRTASDSELVELLCEAARRGKEVTVVVEIKARFDEAANIELATRLQEAGANVTYGIVGHKTHSKMLLIVRREQGVLRRYVHLSTGNYHPGTARAYTDIGLLTCDSDLAEDVQDLFGALTGLQQRPQMRKMLIAPFTLQSTLLELIGAEAKAARAGKPARIIAKFNALTERRIIRALYEASGAGVEIDLIVRGVCCLRPGLGGVSEHIRVRSVVGRFLEHSRLYYFLAGGDEKVFISSADWMGRSFMRRVESAVPIEDPELKQRVLDDGLQPYLDDTAQAWNLARDGSYERVTPKKKAQPVAAQQVLMARAHDT